MENGWGVGVGKATGTVPPKPSRGLCGSEASMPSAKSRACLPRAPGPNGWEVPMLPPSLGTRLRAFLPPGTILLVRSVCTPSKLI
eukprot:3343205-Pleurochrysis_carterae.AAC.2